MGLEPDAKRAGPLERAGADDNRLRWCGLSLHSDARCPAYSRNAAPRGTPRPEAPRALRIRPLHPLRNGSWT